MNLVGVKKSFTLMELILVIILISSTYFLVFTSSSFEIKNTKEKFYLISTKEYLLNNFEFENSISLICIEDDFSCFVEIDKTINSKTKINKVFNTKPEVYEYNKDQIQMDFESIRINDIDFDVIFKYTINSDFKSNELILDTLENKVFIFNSLFDKANVYTSVNEAFEVFNKNILEVRDAF